MKIYEKEALPIGIALPTQSIHTAVAKRTSRLRHVSKCTASHMDSSLALLGSPVYSFWAARQRSRPNSRTTQGIALRCLAQKEKKITDIRNIYDHPAGEETSSVQLHRLIIGTGVEEPIV